MAQNGPGPIPAISTTFIPFSGPIDRPLQLSSLGCWSVAVICTRKPSVGYRSPNLIPLDTFILCELGLATALTGRSTFTLDGLFFGRS